MLDLLQSLSGRYERGLDRDETLFRTGDTAIGLVVVREGGLELRRLSPEGRLSILHRAGPGDTFAEASLFEPRHHCDAIATVRSQVTVFPASAFRQAAVTDQTLGWRIAAHLAQRLVAERARAERLALPRAADRVLDALHALPADASGLRRIGGSWKALAAEVGLSHEATYRALARLERAGTLLREGSQGVRLQPGA